MMKLPEITKKERHIPTGEDCVHKITIYLDGKYVNILLLMIIFLENPLNIRIYF